MPSLANTDLLFLLCVGPVSYTHLDVYKRQMFVIVENYGKLSPEAGRNFVRVLKRFDYRRVYKNVRNSE